MGNNFKHLENQANILHIGMYLRYDNDYKHICIITHIHCNTITIQWIIWNGNKSFIGNPISDYYIDDLYKHLIPLTELEIELYT